MKSIIKLAIGLVSFGVNAASYWDADSCDDVAVTVPANGT